MRMDRVPVDDIDVPSRLRAVDDDKVKQLSESLKAIGLQTPITIHQEHPDQEGFNLVTGAHRLGAAKLLGWEWIDVMFTDADEIDRQLWEIDENLMRAELTITQQGEHLAKRKELWEARETANAVRSFEGRGNKGFASETASVAGVTPRAVQKAIARVEGTTQEARDTIRGTEHDKGVVLDELKKLPAPEQAERAAAIIRGAVNHNKIDMDVKARAAKEVAEIIAEHVPGDCWDLVKANLYSAGAKNIANEFTNITGEAVMDCRYGG